MEKWIEAKQTPANKKSPGRDEKTRAQCESDDGRHDARWMTRTSTNSSGRVRADPIYDPATGGMDWG